MDAKVIIGRFVRTLREQKRLTQEQVAVKTDITYQYLSGLENGRENFSIDVLEALGLALDCPLPQLVAGAFSPAPAVALEPVNNAYFRPKVPLPPGMKVAHLAAAIGATQGIVSQINANLLGSGGKPLPDYIQGNNFSGLVSNMLCDSLHNHSPYRHNSHQAYPDLINPSAKEHGKPAGLEVKTTIKVGKGGESHNGHAGWHLVACFTIEPQTGNIRFVHLMFAVLNNHSHPEPDWKYVGSKVNAETGNRRTETFNTTPFGTTKLRDGTVYLDPNTIHFERWKQQRRGSVPAYSIFAK